MSKSSTLDNERESSRSISVSVSDQRRNSRGGPSKLVRSTSLAGGSREEGRSSVGSFESGSMEVNVVDDFWTEELLDSRSHLVVSRVGGSVGSSSNDDEVRISREKVGAVSDGDGGLELVSCSDPDLDSSSFEIGDGFWDSVLKLVLDGGRSEKNKGVFDFG